MKKKLSIISFCFLISACDNANNSTANTASATIPVEVVSIQTQPLVHSVLLPGRTSSVRTAEVRPQVTGIIQKRLFTEGGIVKAGQQLYQIDPATYVAAYEKAKAQFTNTQEVLNRYKPLLKEKAVSQQTYEAAVSSFIQAKADLATAKVNLDFTQVRAPISGTIGRSGVTEGALVSSGQTTAVATITQSDPIYVDISESSTEMLKLRRALQRGLIMPRNSHEASVKLILEDGTTYEHAGRLEFSEVRVDQGTGSVTMRASFPNPENILLPGMFVHGEVTQGVQTDAVMIPQKSIMRDNKGNAFVYVVGDKNQVVERAVSTGEMQGSLWQITEGLKPQEQVLISGLQQVRPGETVQPLSSAQQVSNTDSSIALSMTDPSAR